MVSPPVCDKDNKLTGIITDGDLRRAIIKYGKDIFDKSASDLMTGGAKTIEANSLAVEALRTMEQYAIADLLITDDKNTPIGGGRFKRST